MDVIYFGQSISSNFAIFLPKSYKAKFCAEESSKQKALKHQGLTKRPIPKLGSDRYIYARFYIDFIA